MILLRCHLISILLCRFILWLLCLCAPDAPRWLLLLLRVVVLLVRNTVCSVVNEFILWLRRLCAPDDPLRWLLLLKVVSWKILVSKDGVMEDPVLITVSDPIMMHDFAITENYAVFMDLPLYFRPKEMVKEKKFIFSFDSTKKARFGILPRYAKNEALIKWFELPNCFIFHNANAWEEGDEVVLITCRLQNPDLDMVNGTVKEKLENFTNEL